MLLKTLVNAGRLKIFNSKTSRPDYLLDEKIGPFTPEEKDNDDENKDDTNKPNSHANTPSNRSRVTPQETQDDDLVQKNSETS